MAPLLQFAARAVGASCRTLADWIERYLAPSPSLQSRFQKSPSAPLPAAGTDACAAEYAYYLQQANAVGMDVNDWLVAVHGWGDTVKELELTTYPYLQPDSRVYEIGPGTGRQSRLLAARLPEGELHLVEKSPWLANFLRGYFQAQRNVQVHLCEGHSLPAASGEVDMVCSFGTFIMLKLDAILIYSREIHRVLKPGGHFVFDYLNVSFPSCWEWLETNAIPGSVFTYHVPEVLDRVVSSAGFDLACRHDTPPFTWLVLRKAHRTEAGGSGMPSFMQPV